MPDVAVPDLGELEGIPNLVKGEPVNRPVDPVIVAARVGASDATSMNAGKVNITVSGTIGAGGDYGGANTIRSVGGGGGTLTLSGTLVRPAMPEPGSVSAQVIYAVGLGAKNSLDSSGADIESTHTGEIMTAGKASLGVLLQSIGGGGGSALVDLQTEDPTDVDSVRARARRGRDRPAPTAAASYVPSPARCSPRRTCRTARWSNRSAAGAASAIAHVGLRPSRPVTLIAQAATSGSVHAGDRVARRHRRQRQ